MSCSHLGPFQRPADGERRHRGAELRIEIAAPDQIVDHVQPHRLKPDAKRHDQRDQDEKLDPESPVRSGRSNASLSFRDRVTYQLTSAVLSS